MRMYVGHATQFDYKKELYEPLKRSMLAQQHTLIFPHAGNDFQNSKEIIKTCDLMVAEVSFASTGLGIELGWANDLNIPIIAIYKKGANPTAALAAVTKKIQEYSDETTLEKIITEALTA